MLVIFYSILESSSRALAFYQKKRRQDVGV
ncbi:hypothetical protein SAMN05414139_10143 [Burkholderia sp. D7]|nr:hypothetical protein SAMN05414139_10143 [Burkholderia sp. D7]